MPVPTSLTTDRLHLRPWDERDVSALLPILADNQAHIGPWIPRHVSAVVAPHALAERLAGFAARFAAAHEWRYALLLRSPQAAPHEPGDGLGTLLLGELSLFPRNATGRVPFPEADRAEIGYWLREDMTGRGLVTEGVRAIIDVARACGSFAHLEIRCDARNLPSAAVPRRLGFQLMHTEREAGVHEGEAAVELQTWTWSLGPRRGSAASGDR